jgi:hypothetical protein
MDKSKAIAKAIEASYFKIRGKLLEAKCVGSITWQFVIWKETKNKKTGLKEKHYYAFSTKDSAVVSKLSSAVRNQRFKVKFKAESVLIKERWYTNMICHVLEDWIANEDKLNREARMQSKQVTMFDDNHYNKSTLSGFGFQKPSE